MAFHGVAGDVAAGSRDDAYTGVEVVHIVVLHMVVQLGMGCAV